MRDRPTFGRLARPWPDLAVALALEVALGTYLSMDEGGEASFELVKWSIFVVELAYLGALAVAAVVWLVRRRPWRAAASAAKCAVLPLLIGPCLACGDYVHLALRYPAYRAEIAARGGGPARFFRGDNALWVPDGLQEDTLVYDPTDALAAAVGTDRDGGPDAIPLTRRLVGPFYVERRILR